MYNCSDDLLKAFYLGEIALISPIYQLINTLEHHYICNIVNISYNLKIFEKIQDFTNLENRIVTTFFNAKNT